MTEFPQAYYAAAGDVNDIKTALNTSFGDYSTYFFTSDSVEAFESIETLRRLINLREAQVELARTALAAYESQVRSGGAYVYGEFQREAYESARQARLAAAAKEDEETFQADLDEALAVDTDNTLYLDRPEYSASRFKAWN